MKQWLTQNWQTIALLLVVIIAAGLRFYNLDWDANYSLHPDERNIASAVMNLDFSQGQYNPHFFAYGSFPIYLTALFANHDFDRAVVVGRVINATLATAIVPLCFILCLQVCNLLFKDKQRNKKYALLAALLVAFNPGLIQFAHFATFEIFLTIEYVLVAISGIELVKKGSWKWYILTGIFIGISISTKVVSLAILPILPIAHLLYKYSQTKLTDNSFKSKLGFLLKAFDLKLIFSLLLVAIFAIGLSPFILLDNKSFQDSLNYEGPVADGILPVFYTQQFIQTTPVVYQLVKVFPYILGWPLEVLGFGGLVLMIIFALHLAVLFFRNSWSEFIGKTELTITFKKFLAVAIFVLVPLAYAIFHFSLYVKWTRYMVPLLPFLIISAIVSFHLIWKNFRKIGNWFAYTIIGLVVTFSVFSGLNFASIYGQPDPRIVAGNWIGDNVPQNAQILSEVYDLGIVPTNTYFPISNIELFNFYDLDNHDNDLPQKLETDLAKTDYILVLSNRLYVTRFRLADRYPVAAKFYQQLSDGTLGYSPVAEFSRPDLLDTWLGKQNIDLSSDIKLSDNSNYWQTPDESFSVFDAPTLILYKKVGI